MAFVAGHAKHADAFELNELPAELDRLPDGVDAGAVHPCVDLDQHANRRARGARCPGDLGCVLRLVDRHHHLGVARKRGNCGQLLRSRDRVDDEDAVEAGSHEHHRLPHRRSGQAYRTCLDLQARQLGALVHLDVRPDLGRLAFEPARHLLDVSSRGRQVEDQRRRHDLGPAFSDRGAIGVPDTRASLFDHAEGMREQLRHGGGRLRSERAGAWSTLRFVSRKHRSPRLRRGHRSRSHTCATPGARDT